MTRAATLASLAVSGALSADSSGNVGIGTSSPGSKLEVNQGILTINTTDQSLTRLRLKNTGAGGRTWEIVGGLPGVNNSNFSIYDSTAAATRAAIDSSGNFQFNSGYGSVATAYGCRAWVNFNGTGTVAIRGSGNVSSITDNALGNYTVNFTTAMPDANYSAVGIASSAGTTQDASLLNILAASVQVLSHSAASPSGQDSVFMCVSVFR